MKNIIRMSLVLLMLCLFVTANESNAATQTQQDNMSTSFKNDYLPDYTVSTMDEEKPILLARRWGNFKRKHRCFDRRAKDRLSRMYYKSRWCRSKRAQKAQRARKHYRRMVVAYHKRKAQVRKKPLCRISRSLLNPKGIGRKKSRCLVKPPWSTKKGRDMLKQSRGRF